MSANRTGIVGLLARDGICAVAVLALFVVSLNPFGFGAYAQTAGLTLPSGAVTIFCGDPADGPGHAGSCGLCTLHQGLGLPPRAPGIIALSVAGLDLPWSWVNVAPPHPVAVYAQLARAPPAFFSPAA